jgi:hypothetical protein
MTDLAALIQAVLRADYEAIESARDRVTREDLGELARVYTTLPSWRERVAMVHLVQDYLDPRLRPMMADVLRAPGDVTDDTLGLAKAIALCHLHEDFDRFSAYYGDRRRLAQDVERYLAQEEPAAEAPPEPVEDEAAAGRPAPARAADSPSASPLTILGTTILIVGVGLLVLALMQRARISRFRRDGVEAEARVISVYEDRDLGEGVGEGANCIEISYFDASLLEGGDLHFADICEFVAPAVRRSLRRDDRIPIVYLPRDPEEDVLLRDVVENGVSPVPTVLGILGVLFGGVLLAINRYYNRPGVTPG